MTNQSELTRDMLQITRNERAREQRDQPNRSQSNNSNDRKDNSNDRKDSGADPHLKGYFKARINGGGDGGYENKKYHRQQQQAKDTRTAETTAAMKDVTAPKEAIKCDGCGKLGHLHAKCWRNPPREITDPQ